MSGHSPYLRFEGKMGTVILHQVDDEDQARNLLTQALKSLEPEYRGSRRFQPWKPGVPAAVTCLGTQEDAFE